MEERLNILREEFQKRFPAEPRYYRAPGRVNLIGEHTDYNDGFVMPFAIDRDTIVAAAARDDTKINVVALDLNETVTVDLAGPAQKLRRSWVDYVEGTARCAAERFGPIGGADLVITSTVPIGAGLSSSAAIEVSVGMALLSLTGYEIDRRELAFSAQQAEHQFVGTRSGIMDQFTSAFAKEGTAMLLDCRSLEIDWIPIGLSQAEVIGFDTKVKHDLATSEYNTRRAECEEGVRILAEYLPGLTSLRDLALADLERYRDRLPDHVFRRCRHVVSENARTLAAAEAFRKGDVVTAGKLMIASHHSLRDDYEVSCPELDVLVEATCSIDGVYGARMTGGGFGGCTVNLVDKNAIADLRLKVSSEYEASFGFRPEFYVFKAADGASEVTR